MIGNTTTSSSSRALSGNWRTNTRTPTPPPPPPGSSTSSFNKDLSAKDVEVGLVTHFKFESLPQDSIVRKQAWVNETATNHPLVIASIKANGNVVCLPVTSFDGKTVPEKFPRANHIQRLHYLPVNHDNKTTTHNGLPVLQLAHGSFMKQSYIHIDQFFEIEPTNLIEWNMGKTLLSRNSIKQLHHHWRDLFTGFTPCMPGKPGRPLSPLHGRRWTCAELGLPSQLPAVATTSPHDFSRDLQQAVKTAIASHTNPKSTKGAVSRVSVGPWRMSQPPPPPPPQHQHRNNDRANISKDWRRRSGNGIRKVSPLTPVKAF